MEEPLEKEEASRFLHSMVGCAREDSEKSEARYQWSKIYNLYNIILSCPIPSSTTRSNLQLVKSDC